MLFNSLDFAFFLPIVFILYWVLKKDKPTIQNILLLVASYFFYSSWDYRFLFLLVFSTLLDYGTGIRMFDAKSKGEKRFWFWLSIGINLGFLGFFKYYNFFVGSFAEMLAGFGFQANMWTLKVILPVGISFYTFHGLSYVIDIYNDKIKPERNFVDYSLFVSFFPLLVAGPIERATHLLPQIKKNRTFTYEKGVDGLRQILWGLFKKIVIADNCAELANTVFNDYAHQSGINLVLGAVFFAFQIYGDFSGYSDIALGTARLFGIELLQNFSFPYFSRDIAEFWRRWHISLSSWFKDYLYIPLGGNKGNKLTQIRNTFIIFIVSGFWHGANWTFIVWGALNACYFLPLLLLKRNRNNLEIVAKGSLFPSTKELLSMLVTFSLTTLAWIFFRADSVEQAVRYIGRIFSQSLFSLPTIEAKKLPYVLALFIVIEWIGREYKYAIEGFALKQHRLVRWSFYLLIALFIYNLKGKEQQFIYFQF